MRITAVTYALGRCGSSLVTGLLAESGLDAGPITDSKSAQNPRGFYEVEGYWNRLRSLYGRWLMTIHEPIPCAPGELDVNEHFARGYFKETFEDGNIVVKVPGIVLRALKDMDLYVVHVRRNPADQEASIFKMNPGMTEPLQELIVKWNDWVEAHLKALEIPHCIVDFDKLIDHPFETYLDMTAEIEDRLQFVLCKNDVDYYVDPSFTHRSKHTA